MIDRPFEELIAGWYRSRVDAEPIPEQLRTRVLTLPQRRPAPAIWPLRASRSPRAALLLPAVLLALALAFALLAAGMALRLFPERSLAFPGDLNACTVLRAAIGPGIRVPYGDGDHGMTAWGAHVCVYDSYDSGYDFRHLFLRTEPTSLDAATSLIDDPSNWVSLAEEREGLASLVAIWRPIAAGVWAGIPAADADSRDSDFDALAVSRAPYFFIVTGHSESLVLGAAHRVAEQLGVSMADVPEVSEWPTFAQPVPTMWHP